jgi:hypothetical protein
MSHLFSWSGAGAFNWLETGRYGARAARIAVAVCRALEDARIQVTKTM